MAFKFKTSQGNQDWAFNNQPPFFVRDPIKFPSLNRLHERNPATNAADADMLWTSIPRTLRGHTYKFTKADGPFHYVKIHINTDAGVKFLRSDEAARLAGTNPDALTLNLFDSIARGDYPSYTVSVQVVHPEDVASCPINIFDMTKVRPKSLHPRRLVGKIVFNQNPSNYFAEIEQAAFSPSTMVPGIEPSADPMLQARMFAYPDAARYRLGVNYQMLPVNQAKSKVYIPTERDGFMNFSDNDGADPNYVGNQIQPIHFKEEVTRRVSKPSTVSLSEPVAFTSEVTDADFVQTCDLWSKIMANEEGSLDRFVPNIAGDVSGAKREWLRLKVYELFSRVDQDLAAQIRSTVDSKLGPVVNEN